MTTQLCPECKGAKMIHYQDTAPGSGATVACPTCAGEGVVDAAAAYVYEQSQKALCDCPGGADSIVVIAGQNRCGDCGRLVPEAR